MNWLQNRQLAIRLLKRTIEWVVFGLFDVWILRGEKAPILPMRAAVVHLQLLGDAVIWIPYGQRLIKRLQANGYEVVLVVNAPLKAIFIQAFPGVEIKDVDRRKILKNWRERRNSILSLRNLGVAKTIQTSAPRDALILDAVVNALGAPAIGFSESFSDRPWFDRRFNDRRYRQLIPSMQNVHQNRRHKAFLQAVGMDTTDLQPAEFAKLPPSPVSGTYWVLSPGAGRNYRRWPEERFAQIVRRMSDYRSDWQCVIVGTAQEKGLAQSVAREASTEVIDLTGRTDLLTLVAVIAQARLLLGNDSAAGHIAAATGTPSVVVVGGGDWKRCYPYDPAEAPVRALPRVASHLMPCFGCNWICRYTARPDQPFPCIDEVDVESVWQEVQSALAPLKTP